MRILRTSAACAAVACLAVAGCGGDDDDADKLPDISDAPAQTQAPTPTQADTAPPTTERGAVKRVADQYIEAFASSDERAACRTRTPLERQELAKSAGTCEDGFKAIFSSAAASGAADMFEGSEVPEDRITIRDDRAKMPLVKNGSTQLELYGLREGGRWYVVSIPDGRADAYLAGRIDPE